MTLEWKIFNYLASFFILVFVADFWFLFENVVQVSRISFEMRLLTAFKIPWVICFVFNWTLFSFFSFSENQYAFTTLGMVVYLFKKLWIWTLSCLWKLRRFNHMILVAVSMHTSIGPLQLRLVLKLMKIIINKLIILIKL